MQLMYRQVLFSIIATLLTIFIGAAYSFFVPEIIKDDANVSIDLNRTYTKEELDLATKQMEDRLKLKAQTPIKIELKEQYITARERAIWISWAPWMVIAVLFFIYKWKLTILTLVPLFFALTLQLILPIELIICSCIVIAAIIARAYNKAIKASTKKSE